MTSSNYLNRRSWAIDQQKKARAQNIAKDTTERVEMAKTRLAHLRKLAIALADIPYMRSTLEAVQKEISTLEQHYP